VDGEVDNFAIAYSLSSACGIRPFIVLAFTASSMWSGAIHPDPHFAWLGNGPVAVLLWLLAILELLADKIPIVDHIFHAIHFATKPVAAALVAGATIHFQDVTSAHMSIAIIVMVAAAANALGLHSLAVILRIFSSSVSFGTANPFVSISEDVALVGAMIVAFMLPIVGVALAVAITVIAIAMCRLSIRTFRKMQTRILRLRTLYPGPPQRFLLRIIVARCTRSGRSELRSAWN
jgi:hypothetical protein